MGFSKCSQYCDSGVTSRLPNAGKFCSEPSTMKELVGLSYTPPPPPDSRQNLEALLGVVLPVKPVSRMHGSTPKAPVTGLSTSSRSSAYPSCARPGEPVNKVFVQFSNDLEGFLPYTLVISEEQGLEFASLSDSPDFALDPLNILKADRVSYDVLMRDTFFTSLSRSILSRPELRSGAASPEAAQAPSPAAILGPPPPSLEERVRPPYTSVVQLSVRRPLLEGGQVLVFIAVQSEPLADELVRSSYQLRKRRAVRSVPWDNGGEAPAFAEYPSTVPSRGCPTPRTVASQTPGATPLRSPRGAGARPMQK